MTVYLVHEEWNSGESLSVPAGIYASRAAAEAAQAACIAEAKSLGNQVYGHEDDEQDEADWDVDVHIEEMQLDLGNAEPNAADTVGPPIGWETLRQQLDPIALDATREAAAYKAQHYGRIAGYFTSTHRSHTWAVKNGNKIVRQIRAALGFTYTKANDLNF